MIVLTVDGKRFDGWLSAEVEKSLDQFAHRFSLSYLDRWNGDPWQIRAGSACTVSWDQTLLVTGHVNRARFRASENEWMLSADGRSLGGDLCDASAVHATGSWSAKSMKQIADDLLKPYGKTATVRGDDEPFARFALEDGETVFAAIDRMAKVRALLPLQTADGNVTIGRVGTGSVAKLDMTYVITSQLAEDDSDRHSEYLVRGIGADGAKAVARDGAVKRYRPLVVIGDAPSNTARAMVRAEWERNIRAGRSERVMYTLRGAHLHEPGQLMQITDPVLGVDERMILVRTVLRSSERELVTEYELGRPEAYQPLEYPEKLLSGRTKRGKAIRHRTVRR